MVCVIVPVGPLGIGGGIGGLGGGFNGGGFGQQSGLSGAQSSSTSQSSSFNQGFGQQGGLLNLFFFSFCNFGWCKTLTLQLKYFEFIK